MVSLGTVMLMWICVELMKLGAPCFDSAGLCCLQSADVFAFGVLLWEMLSGERAWDKQTPAQIMLAVALQQNMLTLPPTCLPELNRCAPALAKCQLLPSNSLLCSCVNLALARYWGLETVPICL